MSGSAEPTPPGPQQRPTQLSGVTTLVEGDGERQTPAQEAEQTANGQTEDIPFELLLDENPDVDYIAEIPEDAACLISQPDGSVVVGIDTSKVPTDPLSRTRRQRRRQRTAEARMQAESRAAFHALRAQQAVFYRRTVVRPRRFVYMGLVGADMLFFLICLLVQAFTSGLHMGRKWSSVGVNGVNLYWWPTPKTLTLEEVAFSLVVDLVGVMAGFQEKPPVLGLFLLLDLITTILIGIHGISLFLLFRGAQMAACILYRNALVHCMGMSMTEEERLEFLSTELGIMTIFHTMAGFCGVLCGIEPQQAQRASRDGQAAAASTSPRESSAAAPPEQLMGTHSTLSRTASTAGTAEGPGTAPEAGAAAPDEAQTQPPASPTEVLQAPSAGEALERQPQPQAIGPAVPIPPRGALALAGTATGAEPLTTVAVFSFAAGAAHASVQRSDTASSRQPDASVSPAATEPTDWRVMHTPWVAAHAAGAALGAAGGAAGQAVHTVAGAFSALLSSAAAPGASHATPPAAAAPAWFGSPGVGSGMHSTRVGMANADVATIGYRGHGSAASATVAWSQQPQQVSLWPYSQGVQQQNGPRSASTLHPGAGDSHIAAAVATAAVPAAIAPGEGGGTNSAAPVESRTLCTSSSGRGWLPDATTAAGAAHGEGSAAESGLGRSPCRTPQSQHRGLQLQALQLQLQLTQMSLRLQQQQRLQVQVAQDCDGAKGDARALVAVGGSSGTQSRAASARPVPRPRRTGIVRALLSAFAPSKSPIKPRRVQTVAVASSTPGLAADASGMDLSLLASGTARRECPGAVREARGSLTTHLHGAPPHQPAEAVGASGAGFLRPAPNGRQQQPQEKDHDSPLPHASWQPDSFACNGPGGMSGAAVAPWPSSIAVSGAFAQQDTLSWRPDQHHSSVVLQQQQQQQQPFFQHGSNQSYSFLSPGHGLTVHESGHEASRTATADFQRRNPYDLQSNLAVTGAMHLRPVSMTSNGATESPDPRSLGLAASSLSAPTAASVMSLPAPKDAAEGTMLGAAGGPEVSASQQQPAVLQQRKMLTAVEAALAEAQRLRRALEDRRKATDNAANFATVAALLPPGSRQAEEGEPLTGVAAAARAAAVPFSRSAKRREHGQSRFDVLASDADVAHTAGAAKAASRLSAQPWRSADEGTRASAQLATGLDSIGTGAAAVRDEGAERLNHAAGAAPTSPATGFPSKSTAFSGPCLPAQPLAAVSIHRVQQQPPSLPKEFKVASHAVRPRVAAGPDEWAAGRGVDAGCVKEQGCQAQGVHKLKPTIVQHLSPGPPRWQRVDEPGSRAGAEQWGPLHDVSPRRR